MIKAFSDYSSLIHLSKVKVNETKLKITYYFDGKIETQTFADSSEYDDAVSAIEDNCLLIGDTYYNTGRLSIAEQNGATVTYQFVGNVIIAYEYESVADAEDAVATLEDSFFKIDNKYYNAAQMVVANTDSAALEIIYDFGGNQIKVTYEDSAAFEEATTKLAETSGGSGGGGGGGGGGKSVATPTFTLKPGAVDVGAKTKITCSTEGADIYFTTDGSTPTLDSPKYTGEDITVPEGGITIKAIGVKLGLATSKVATGAYTIYVGPAKRYAGWYVGAEAPATLTATDITGLDGLYTDEGKTPSSPDPFVFTITEDVVTNSGCITWAYPAEYGTVAKFKDGLGEHAITDSYVLKTVEINGVEYNVYIMETGTTGEVGEELPQVFIAAD